jgi:CRP-like cAMP-binding protein
VITAAELALIPLFTGLDESARQRLAQKAADIRAEGGDWVIREGEDPRVFAVLEGLLQVVKDIVGQRRELEQLNAGEFFGETPILLGTANLVSVQAVSRCPPGPFRSPAASGADSRFLLLRHHHF